MSNYNNSLLYYKKYYDGINWTLSPQSEHHKPIFEVIHGKIKASKLPPKADLEALYPTTLHPLELTTTYPGLLLGTGIPHGTGRLGESKIGFYFDYTTGLPVIPGSSVKGVLRSVFPGAVAFKGKKSEQPAADIAARGAQFEAFLAPLLKEISKVEWSRASIDKLEDWLFGSMEGEQPAQSMSGRTVFHDAFPIQSRNEHQKYLDFDFITPHRDPLKNPVPIQFLKVLPGVTFRFQFALFDYKEGDAVRLTTDQQKQLFQRILCLLGVGAKTNVGYGQLEGKDIWNVPGAAASPLRNVAIEIPKPMNQIQREDILIGTLIRIQQGANVRATFSTQSIVNFNNNLNVNIGGQQYQQNRNNLIIGNRYNLRVTNPQRQNFTVVIHSFDPLP